MIPANKPGTLRRGERQRLSSRGEQTWHVLQRSLLRTKVDWQSAFVLSFSTEWNESNWAYQKGELP
jgi:hypothetical protein